MITATPAAPVEPADLALQPPQPHRVGRDAEIRLGLATAGREPEQVGDGVGGVGAILDASGR